MSLNIKIPNDTFDHHLLPLNSPPTNRTRPSTWTYDDRYNFQHIIDSIYLGPACSVKEDHDRIESEGITRIVATCSKLGPRFVGIPNKLPRDDIVVDDGEICDHAQEFLAILEAERARNGKVLVVCEDGNARSAAFVCLYLIRCKRLSVTDSIIYVTSRRYSTYLSHVQSMQLEHYEHICKPGEDVTVKEDTEYGVY